MDYSPKHRIAPPLPAALRAPLLAALLLPLATGCPPRDNPPAGERPETAEDLYRQGRAIEDRVASSDTDARANLQQARAAYGRALQAKPDPRLASYIHTGLGNVAFYQDDYATAVNEFATAYDRLDDPGLKSMTLLRMGTSLQRLGRFEQADRTFLSLQQTFPNSEAAKASRAKYGARAFFLQLAVFQQPALADKAVAQLRQSGVPVTRTPDAQGRQVLRAGPLRSYAEAEAMKSRLAGTYPGAIVTP